MPSNGHSNSSHAHATHTTHKHSHHAPLHPHLKSIVKISFPEEKISVHVPARDHEDAHKTLTAIANGGIGTGLQNTYLGHATPKIRAAYYDALAAVEKEISARKIALGPRLTNPAEYRQFAFWASQRRTTVARLYRIPAGPGSMIGLEYRDWRVYGVGGRTPENVLSRNMSNKLVPRSEEQALAKMISSAVKPNAAETERLLKAAKFLKRGGTVFIVGGLALTGYEIYRAKPADRPELIRKEVLVTGGSILASDLAVGIAIACSLTGVGLIAVGIIAGVGGAIAAERMYYANHQSQNVQEFHASGITHVKGLTTFPH